MPGATHVIEGPNCMMRAAYHASVAVAAAPWVHRHARRTYEHEPPPRKPCAFLQLTMTLAKDSRQAPANSSAATGEPNVASIPATWGDVRGER